MRIFLRLVPGLLFLGLGYLSTEIARRSVQLWTITNREDDLVAYATWQTLTWVFIGLSLVSVVWAWLASRND